MVETLYGLEKGHHDYILNSFNHFKFGKDKILITAEHGAWALLSDEEFKLLRLHRVESNPELFTKMAQLGFILTEENIERIIEDYRLRNFHLFMGPSLHIVVPTLRCNQRCIYCHSRAEPLANKKFDMSKKTAKKTVEFIFESPVNMINLEFQGGDFLLNYKLTEFMIDYAKKLAGKKNKELTVSMVTNLTLMNEKILKSLKKRKIMGLATSLDGPKDVHDKNRMFLNGTGTYDKVVYWIDRIKTEWVHDFNLNALCTITRYSLGKEKGIVDEYLKHGFTGVFLRPLNNIGFAADNWDKIGYTADEYISSWKRALHYILQRNLEGKFIVEGLSVIFLKKILEKAPPFYVDVMTPCGAGISQLLYKQNGDIHTCDEGKLFGEFKLGNVFTSHYEDLFKNKALISMIDISSRKNYLCDNCVWNPYCGVCPVYTYATQNTIVSKLAVDDKCKTNASILKTIFEKTLFSKKYRNVFYSWLERERFFSTSREEGLSKND